MIIEYFIIENRNKTGRDASLPDSGLAIWHIDELGDNSNEQMTKTSHYECSLMQADGKNDLEKRVNNGDTNDLYDKTINKRFSNTTMPNSKWWDGTSSKLEIFDVGPAGKNVKFSARI